MNSPRSHPSVRPLPVPRVLVIVGPTASGKTLVSLRVAELLKGEIISADSRQIFKYLDIGTAKPTPEQRHKIRHHFVDELKPDQDFNAGEFGLRGREVIQAILDRRRVPIVIGGSGLYVRSLIDGFFEGPGADPEYREILEARLKKEGLEALLAELRAVDPDFVRTVDVTKPRRILRALEVHHIVGEPLSRLQKERVPEINFRSVQFGLLWERKELYARINARCDEMLASGLLTEVESLEKQGYQRDLQSLNTVGYAEAFAYRNGEISYDEMVRLLRQNSRRYAKRQLTWFRRDDRIRWISIESEEGLEVAAEEIAKHFERET